MSLRFEPLEDRRMMATLPAGFAESVVASNLTSPITMDIAPNGRIWVAYQDGRIEVIENDVLLPTPAIQLDCDGSGERGLQGIELDPHFEHNGFIYVYYTAAHNQSGQLASHNRLSRLTVDPTTENTIIPGSEVILLELPEFSTFPNNQNPIWHMGGAIHLLPDETIAVQVGDHLNNSIVQNNNAPLGKILRANKNGTAPTDNPFYNAADTNPPGGSDWNGNAPGDIDWIDYVWASGLRNPFSGDVDPVTGRYFVNDVGEGLWEEIDDATAAGRNFGWPTTEGNFNPATYPNFTNPVLAYSHSEDSAITGGAFYSGTAEQFPAQYRGAYFYSQFTAGRIRYFDPANPGGATTFASGISYPMNIEIAPDGSLYYIERGAGAGGAPGIGTGRVVKVQYAAAIPPQIVSHPASTLVSVGYDASFTVSVSGTPPLSYQWQRRSGNVFVDIPGATVSTLTLNDVTLADDNAQFRVVVKNDFGTATSNAAVLDVTSDTPPTPVIDLPAAGLKYRAGDTIQFSGHASDTEDGTLAAAQLTWQVDFHHATHTHPFVPPTSGITGGQFTIPAIGETSSDVWYRIRLIATDSAGLTTETFRDVVPEKTDFVVLNNLGGGNVLVDGQTRQAPFATTGVVNIERTIEAPLKQGAGGNSGVFVQWLDGVTDRERTFATPENDTAYVALYEDTPTTAVFLSDLVPSNDPPPNGWGPIEYDTSNGEAAAGDGNPMTIGGVRYSKGLGVHAPSDVRYNLGGTYSRFIADVGLDDETGAGGSVVFQVFGDGNLLFDSGTRFADNAATGQPLRVDVNVASVNELRLVVTDNGDGNGLDHADWGNARLLPTGSGANIYVNFQPNGSPTVSGYLADTGQVYGEQGGGQAYGWSQVVTMRDRDATTANDLYETHAEIPANQSRTWSIRVPNGTYAVTVSIGDAGGTTNDTNSSVTVEGTSYWNALALQNDEFAQQTRLITVSDGRLSMVVSSGSATLPAAVNFIEVVPVPVEPSTGLFPLASADLTLDGKLTYADVLAFGAGWGSHTPSATLEQLVRAGDLNFDRVTDLTDWSLFHQAWTNAGMPALHLQAVINPLAGDFDRSGVVNDTDYNLWRNTFGSTKELAADGNGNGTVDAADYTAWRDHLGDMIPPAFDNLLLSIDPATGEGRITNYSAFPISLIGYSIESAGASLLPANGNWNSLHDQLLANWQEASPTTSVLSELTTSGALVLQPYASFELGHVFNANMAHSGVSLEYVVTTSTAEEIGDVTFAAISGQGQASSMDFYELEFQSAGTTAVAELASPSVPIVPFVLVPTNANLSTGDPLRPVRLRRIHNSFPESARASIDEQLFTDLLRHAPRRCRLEDAANISLESIAEELVNIECGRDSHFELAIAGLERFDLKPWA
ncbi:MAG: NPCBM/NEW2 domain-containing protein [Pirellulales bacterium]